MSRRGKKGKNSLLTTFVIIIAFLAVGIISYYIYKDYTNKLKEKNSVKIHYVDNLTAEINSNADIIMFIDSVDNGEVVNMEDKVDTSTLGSQKLTLLVLNKDGEEEKHEFKIEIIDTIKPVIEAKNEITIYVGNNPDLLKDVKVTDNSAEEIKAEVSGEYDKNKTGKYNLKYEATDSSGNKSEYDFILNIISDPNNRVFTTSKGFSGKVVNGVTYIDGVLIANKTYKLPNNYGSGLTSETQNAFNKMKNDANGQGLNLYIGSGYRSYYDQQYIYNNYVKRDGQAAADTYSARAGHSEHQTGLAFDVCERNTSACISSWFNDTAAAKWMSDNCYKYGLILRYPKGKDNLTGYMYESWHFRYVGVELATKLYNGGNWITLEEYYGIDSKYS